MFQRLVSLVVFALFLSSCSGVQGTTSAAAPPADSKPAPGAPAARAASGGTTIDLSVSGTVTGSSKQLSAAKASECVDVGGAKVIGIYALNLYPVLNGKTAQVSLMIGNFTGPQNLSLPADVGRVTTYIDVDDGSESSTMYTSGKTTTGTIVFEATGGSIDVKGLKPMFGAAGDSVDMRVRWTCGK